ncbi:MAG: SCO family protein [Anaerolineae bacterium]
MAEKSAPLIVYHRLPFLPWRWFGMGVLVVLAVGVFAFATLKPVKVLPRMQLAPGFALVDQNGAVVTNESLRGQIVLYTFGYTRCGARCADLTATMRLVQDGLTGLDLADVPVRLITISFDPEHDSPSVLADYARSLGANPAVWRFLTGDATRLKYILGGGFEVYYAADDKGGFDFDPALVLVDWNGIVRAKYDLRAVTPDPNRILEHIALLAVEARNSTGPTRLAYEAAHLFLCYAR